MITALWKALQAGEQLENSAGWKNRQTTASLIAAVLGLVVLVLPRVGVTVAISQEDILAIAGGFAAVLGIINSILTVTTSRKVGMSQKINGEGD